MSQYPSPYSPPPQGYPNFYGFDPNASALAPARRAGTLMIVMGILGVLLGVCAGIASRVPLGQYPPETQEQMRLIESMFGSVQRFLTLMAIVAGVPSLLLLIFGMWVRGGSKAAIVTSIIYAAVLAVLMGINLLMMLGRGQAGRGADLLFPVVITGMLVLLLVWLWQALKTSAAIGASQAGFQNQYWQQQQAYWQWHAQQGQTPPPGMAPPPPPGQPPVGNYAPLPPPPPTRPGPPDQPPPQA